MAFFGWSTTPEFDRDMAAMLGTFLPFVGAFLVSRLIYGWISKAGHQSASFSPNVASFLTTPLLAFAYWIVSERLFMAGNVKDVSVVIIVQDLLLFGPVFLVLVPLLVIYLRGGFREMSGIVLCAAAVAIVIVEFIGLFLLFAHTS